jgi:hypothetical protein
MADAHLNGSLNLPSAEDTFRTVAAIAGNSITKIPDGETDERQGWIAALVPRLREVPQLEAGERKYGYKAAPLFSIKPGVTSDEIDVPDLGYAAAARYAYPLFRRLRDEGVITPGTRFQVSMPTVTAGCEPFIAADHQEAFEPAYARRLRAEAEEILAAVPHEDLAMQWDVAVEMGIVEGVFPAHFAERFDGVVSRLGDLSAWIPPEVPLGYHLCYGDAQEVTGQGEGRHWKEPKDTSKLVAVANAVTEKAARPLDWFSMPVPIARDDDPYFEPLADLRLHDRTRLYLGLVHHQDGVEGTQRRIAAAQRHYQRGFGVATECGMGRKPGELIPQLLEIQARVQV